MLGTSLNKTVRYNPYVKEGFLTAIPQSPRRDIQPCIVSNVNFSFIVIFIDCRSVGWVWTSLQISAEAWVWSEHPYRPLSLSVHQSLSLSCASLKCSHPVCLSGCDPQGLSLHKQSGWVCLSSSIHISCKHHLWILGCIVHIQSF